MTLGVSLLEDGRDCAPSFGAPVLGRKSAFFVFLLSLPVTAPVRRNVPHAFLASGENELGSLKLYLS